VFHPSGKFLLSASDDKTVRVWELQTGRCLKTIDAHGHFVTTLSWGRQPASGKAGDASANGTDESKKLVNVVASGSVDQTIKIWLP
jgi:platelet-activating factor acetylhydrolase IB subunit alpha